MDHLTKFGWPWKWLKQPPRCFRWSYVSVLALHAENRTFGSFKSNVRRILIMHMMWHSPTLTILRKMKTTNIYEYMHLWWSHTTGSCNDKTISMTNVLNHTRIHKPFHGVLVIHFMHPLPPSGKHTLFSTSHCKVSPGPYYQPHPGSLKSSPQWCLQDVGDKADWLKSTKDVSGCTFWLLFIWPEISHDPF